MGAYGLEGNSGVKRKEQGSNNKENDIIANVTGNAWIHEHVHYCYNYIIFGEHTYYYY